MKNSRFTEAQIIGVLPQAAGGLAVPDLCCEHGISGATFYKGRAKYGGMDACMMSQMKSFHDENRRLKRMFADLSMQADLLCEAVGKKVTRPTPRRELAEKAVATKGVSIVLACRAFDVSETCFRYSPKLDEEHNMIADLLVGLTNSTRAGGRAVPPASAKRQGTRWEP